MAAPAINLPAVTAAGYAALQRGDLESFDPITRQLAALERRQQEAPAALGRELADIDIVVDAFAITGVNEQD